MLELDQQSTAALIRDVDALARATFTWVRQQTFEQRFLGQPLNAAEESELAAGFLAGLQLGLGLGRTESMLVTYSYALMVGQRTSVPDSALQMLKRSEAGNKADPGFRRGLDAAGTFLGNRIVRQSGAATTVATVYGIEETVKERTVN